MTHRLRQKYSAGTHKNLCHMGSHVPPMSNLSYHGSLIRSSHGGLYKTHGRPHTSCHGGPYRSHHGIFPMFHHGRTSVPKNIKLSVFCEGNVLNRCHQRSPKDHRAHQATTRSSLSHGSTVQNYKSSFKNSRVKDESKNIMHAINQKKVMRQLNERLSSYVEVFNSLEQENERLEKKIGEWYLKNAPRLPPDHTQYARTIQELQNQISAVTSESLAITQRIDSAVISFEDYYNRYEIELSFRKSIDADITGLRSILDGFNGQISKLESELEALEEEILRMKRNNEQAVNALSSQIGTRVSVEVEASPTINLNRTLSGIREEYEKLMERNLGEIEMLFLKRSMSLTSERTSGSVQLESAQVELIDVKHSLQTADIEFQSEKNMISALDVTLVEIQAHYASERAELQRTINIVSEQLGEIRNELESQNEDYQLLVDKKVHLELEIATYQRLLDGPDTNVNEQLSSNNHNEHSNSDEQKDKEHPETRRTRSS